MPIKLDDVVCGARVNSMGEGDVEGDYIEMICTQHGDPGDQPQSMTFSISERVAQNLAAAISNAMSRRSGTKTDQCTDQAHDGPPVAITLKGTSG